MNCPGVGVPPPHPGLGDGAISSCHCQEGGAGVRTPLSARVGGREGAMLRVGSGQDFRAG